MKTERITTESITFSKVLNSFYVYTGDQTDKYVQATCREQGYWDKELTEWMIRNIQPGWVCLDIGANIFYFTEVMARRVGPSGRVLAFEPIERLCKSYTVATILNDYSNVGQIDVFNIALSNKKDNMVLNIWEENIVVELGSGQPDEFLVELNDKYTMEFLNGEAATFERIKEHDVVNVLLRRR